jgi:hypothetical protein
VSNNTDPKREHNYEIVLKPSEVVSFSPENKHNSYMAHGSEKKVCVRKGKRFQDGKGMKGERHFFMPILW